MSSVNGIYIPSPDPKPHPRVRPEATSYAERNRGDSEKWYDYSQTGDYSSPRPAERIISDEARRNANLNKGSMDSIMGGYCDPAIQHTLHPRAVKSDAADIAESNKGNSMKHLMDNYGNMGLSDRPGQRVKGYEAEEYAERNKGVMDNVMYQYGGQISPDIPAPKLGYGGEEVAVKHTGADMGPILRMEGDLRAEQREPKISQLHQASEGPGWDENPPANRSRPEGQDITVKNTETVADKLMRGEVASPTFREPRTMPHMEETPTPRKITSPVRTRPEAMHNYQRNQVSEMAAIMRGESASQSPSKKRNPNFYRSEDW